MYVRFVDIPWADTCLKDLLMTRIVAEIPPTGRTFNERLMSGFVYRKNILDPEDLKKDWGKLLETLPPAAAAVFHKRRRAVLLNVEERPEFFGRTYLLARVVLSLVVVMHASAPLGKRNY